jgi:hypothetical protein
MIILHKAAIELSIFSGYLEFSYIFLKISQDIIKILDP